MERLAVRLLDNVNRKDISMAELRSFGQPFGGASQLINLPAPVGIERAAGANAQALGQLGQGIGDFLRQRKQNELEQADRAALANLGGLPAGQLNDEQTAKGFANIIGGFQSDKFKGIADQIFAQQIQRQSDPLGQEQRQATLGKTQAETLAITAGPQQTPEQKAFTVANTNKLIQETEKLRREAGGTLTQEQKTSQGNIFRKEFDGLSKEFRTSRDAFGRVEASAADPSAAGDLALIFNFMKVLDPSSVVRESEFANAAASGSFGEKVKAAGLKITKGERLSPAIRADFLDRAKRLFKKSQQTQSRLESRFTGLSKRFGINPENVISLQPTESDLAQSPNPLASQLQQGEILVKDKASGQIGALPENEFDPNSFERVQ